MSRGVVCVQIDAARVVCKRLGQFAEPLLRYSDQRVGQRDLFALFYRETQVLDRALWLAGSQKRARIIDANSCQLRIQLNRPRKLALGIVDLASIKIQLSQSAMPAREVRIELGDLLQVGQRIGFASEPD